MGMFNVTYNEPVLLKPVNHKNERKAMLDNLIGNNISSDDKLNIIC